MLGLDISGRHVVEVRGEKLTQNENGSCNIWLISISRESVSGGNPNNFITDSWRRSRRPRRWPTATLAGLDQRLFFSRLWRRAAATTATLRHRWPSSSSRPPCCRRMQRRATTWRPTVPSSSLSRVRMAAGSAAPETASESSPIAKPDIKNLSIAWLLPSSNYFTAWRWTNHRR